MNAGDLVVIITENQIVYVIVKVVNDAIYLRGLNYRIMKVVKKEEIRKATTEEIARDQEKADAYLLKVINLKMRNKRYLLGKILHVDGDDAYLNKCMELYQSVGVYAVGASFEEEEMLNKIKPYLENVRPDIIVVTGHDLYNQQGKKPLENYTNTRNFIDVVKTIRSYPTTSNAIIIAGACQSNYEALIASGADFASSPKRINVHTFDPAVIAIKAACTSFVKVIQLDDAWKYIENGRDAFSGLETLGKMRLIL